MARQIVSQALEEQHHTLRGDLLYFLLYLVGNYPDTPRLIHEVYQHLQLMPQHHVAHQILNMPHSPIKGATVTYKEKIYNLH